MKMDKYESELLWAITGELFGQAMFEEVAKQISDPCIQQKCMKLKELEVVTFQHLVPFVNQYKLKLDKAHYIEKGRKSASKIIELGWYAAMQRFADHIDEDINRMQILHDIAPKDDKKPLVFLVQHEKALKSFALAELTEDENSILFIEECMS